MNILKIDLILDETREILGLYFLEIFKYTPYKIFRQPQTDRHLPQSPFINFFKITTFSIDFYQSNLSTKVLKKSLKSKQVASFVKYKNIQQTKRKFSLNLLKIDIILDETREILGLYFLETFKSTPYKIFLKQFLY